MYAFKDFISLVFIETLTTYNIMILPRIIARIDIKNNYVIKGIHLEGLRKVVRPLFNEFALKYYNQGVDEIVFMDAVASSYDRNQLFDVTERASNDVFVPIAVGGGISCVDVSKALEVGATKQL